MRGETERLAEDGSCVISDGVSTRHLSREVDKEGQGDTERVALVGVAEQFEERGPLFTCISDGETDLLNSCHDFVILGTSPFDDSEGSFGTVQVASLNQPAR